MIVNSTLLVVAMPCKEACNSLRLMQLNNRFTNNRCVMGPFHVGKRA